MKFRWPLPVPGLSRRPSGATALGLLLAFLLGAAASSLFPSYVVWVALVPTAALLGFLLVPRRRADSGVSGDRNGTDNVGAAEDTETETEISRLRRAVELGRERDELLRSFAEEIRSRLGSLRAAFETLESYPAIDGPRGGRLRRVIHEESRALTEVLEKTMPRLSVADWQLERLHGLGLVTRIAAHLEGEIGVRCASEVPDETLWVRAEESSLETALSAVTGALREEFGVDDVRLRLRGETEFATLDLIWLPDSIDLHTLMAWQHEVMRRDDEKAGASLRRVARLHVGETWFNLSRQGESAYLRMLIPASGAPTDSSWETGVKGNRRRER